MTTLAKQDLFDLTKIDKGERTTYSMVYQYYNTLNNTLKEIAVATTPTLFRLYAAATPNYYGMDVSDEDIKELVLLHDVELKQFVDLVIHNRQQEIIYGVSAPYLNRTGTDLVVLPRVSEDTAEHLRLLTGSVERRNAGALIGNTGTGSMVDMINNKLSALYMNMYREFETPGRTSDGRTPLNMVDVDRNDYLTLLNMLKQEILGADKATDHLFVYRALYVFIHLHSYDVLYHDKDDDLHHRGSNFLDLERVLTSFTNGEGDDRRWNSTYGKIDDLRKFNTLCKRYRGYSNLSNLELLAYHPLLECRLPSDPSCQRNAPNRASMFLALQTLVYQEHLGRKKRTGGSDDDVCCG